MIKAEDLRIGDLVTVNENCSLEQGTIGKVMDKNVCDNTLVFGSCYIRSCIFDSRKG